LAEQVFFRLLQTFYEVVKVLCFCLFPVAALCNGKASTKFHSNKKSGQDNKKVSISKILSIETWTSGYTTPVKSRIRNSQNILPTETIMS
jgi:hypothetical protein